MHVYQVANVHRGDEIVSFEHNQLIAMLRIPSRCVRW